MHDHNKTHQHNNAHEHHGCCGHEHNHEHSHEHSHEHNHEHNHEHSHEHNHEHSHEHDHSCCDHDHGHKHLTSHECSALVNKARSSSDQVEATHLLFEAGEGFAHLGDATGTAAVTGLLFEKKNSGMPFTSLQNAKFKAIKAIGQALNKSPSKEELSQSVNDLENFSGAERAEVEQLLGDVRKSLAAIRNSGLKSLLNKLGF